MGAKNERKNKSPKNKKRRAKKKKTTLGHLCKIAHDEPRIRRLRTEYGVLLKGVHSLGRSLHDYRGFIRKGNTSIRLLV